MDEEQEGLLRSIVVALHEVTAELQGIKAELQGIRQDVDVTGVVDRLEEKLEEVASAIALAAE